MDGPPFFSHPGMNARSRSSDLWSTSGVQIGRGIWIPTSSTAGLLASMRCKEWVALHFDDKRQLNIRRYPRWVEEGRSGFMVAITVWTIVPEDRVAFGGRP